MCILGAMSARSPTPLVRDFNKINLFSAQFQDVKIGRDFACKGLRGSSWTSDNELAALHVKILTTLLLTTLANPH